MNRRLTIAVIVLLFTQSTLIAQIRQTRDKTDQPSVEQQTKIDYSRPVEYEIGGIRIEGQKGAKIWKD